MSKSEISVDLRSISKAYGPTVALESVSFRIAAGEIQALLGENGAGKSTIVKVLSGVVAPDAGSLSIMRRPYAPRDPVGARQAGVHTAFQELSLIPNLTVAQNFFLPRSLRRMGGTVATRLMEERVAAILLDHGIDDISSCSLAGDLSLASRQRLEIVRAMHGNPLLLILDEPTAALANVDWLFSLVRKATARGTAVLYISHRLSEIRELASTATVLRSGKSVATVSLAEVSDGDIFGMMVGRSGLSQRGLRARAAAPGRARSLVLNDLTGRGLHGVSLEVAGGEILGVAAFEGQGQRELFQTLSGQAEPTGGQIVLNGRAIRLRSPRHALRTQQGIAYVAEDRKTEGIFPNLSTAANITLPISGRLGRLGIVSIWKEIRAAKAAASQVELQERYLRFRIEDLSGGNQQKALLARALMTGARTLLLYDPTRGVDVGTKEVLYRAIEDFCAAGGAVLLYSTELAELRRIADRCLVMYEGKVVADVNPDGIGEAALVALMSNHPLEARSAQPEENAGLRASSLSHIDR
ncbi:sugar ABC transporter ATP-binding protein [Caballeronia sp. LZ001]|uniref:sugar ABC transporter ATP-binding protein n=1 Tax=Caballeronia sp. LZ001 TaxID=3038553 RepID=UPI00285A30D1|nr:sugar ABC transporter ATP-binding protein [Caballeronia sp. LZ001]MDR5804795.1 sugar ABC transporter ATP-binding protein [Caballeronia sp. LZ001]